MTDFEGLLQRLRDADVRFVLVGGFAGTVLGSPRITVDLDIVYARDADNLDRLARALDPSESRVIGLSAIGLSKPIGTSGHRHRVIGTSLIR